MSRKKTLAAASSWGRPPASGFLLHGGLVGRRWQRLTTDGLDTLMRLLFERPPLRSVAMDLAISVCHGRALFDVQVVSVNSSALVPHACPVSEFPRVLRGIDLMAAYDPSSLERSLRMHFFRTGYFYSENAARFVSEIAGFLFFHDTS